MRVNRSPPSRRRGLKYHINCTPAHHTRRLLHGGVDWNLHKFLHEKYQMSPPSRRRGLKYPVKWSEISCFLRRLLRGGMDWNHVRGYIFTEKVVASFAEAWIEIRRSSFCTGSFWSPPSRRRGLKSVAKFGIISRSTRRLLHGGVDWNR